MSQLVIRYRPIGTIHSPWLDIAGMPIQPSGAIGVRGSIELILEFAVGLRDLEGFLPSPVREIPRWSKRSRSQKTKP